MYQIYPIAVSRQITKWEPNPLRSETNRNVEFVYSVLTLLATQHGQKWSGDYISQISVLVVRLQTDLGHKPDWVIKTLKKAATEFIGWVRSPVTQVSLANLPQHLDNAGYTTYARDLIVLYEQFFHATPIRQSIHLVQLCYAFLSMHRVVLMKGTPSYASITDKATYIKDKQFEGGIPAALSLLGITTVDFKAVLAGFTEQWAYKISTKGGPNGKAIFAARADAIALFNNETLVKAFMALAEHMKMGGLIEDMMETVDLPEYVSKHTDDYIAGRLHSIEEWGGKTRVVAIVDYWTQTLMDPIHQSINHFLRRLPMDGTFNQESVAMRVKAYTTSLTNQVYSFDLTAATDRLPIVFQEAILTALFANDQPALNWRRVLTERDYQRPDGILARYKVGQPMGAKSSFPMLALSHHVIVQLAAIASGHKGLFSDYVIIGDDISINSGKVAIEYQKLMAKLGVAINLDKSVVHTAGHLPAGELAKRLFIHGLEVSAIPVKLIAKMGSQPRFVTQLHDFLIDRGAFESAADVMVMLTGAIDQESARRYLVVNALPSSVTGMKHPGGPLSSNMELTNMYEGVQVDAQDIEEAYLYTAVVEQVKRMDALIKETGVISALVHEKAGTMLGEPDMGWTTPVLISTRSAQKAKLPTLRPNHPFVKAVVAETDRISALLAALRGGTTKVSALAKAHLLDMFRNSVADVFDPFFADEAPVPTFTLVNKALVNLDTMIIDKEGTKLDFSIKVVNLERHYSVFWSRGSGVYVNTVKTRVEQSLTLIRQTSELLAGQVFMSPRRDRTMGASIRAVKRADKAARVANTGSEGRKLVGSIDVGGPAAKS